MQAFKKEFPRFSSFFPFEEFNAVQIKCLKPVTKSNKNVVVSAPTSSGKTVIFQLAIINQIKNGELKCLYLAPIKSLCHEKSASWMNKFQNVLKVFELTSDTSQEEENTLFLQNINLVIATPQKIDSFSRKSLQFLSQINLLLVDEVHMLNFEERGATLQAVISRIMSINKPRIIAVSATIPNIQQVAQWLRVESDMSFIFGEEYRPVKINKVVQGYKSSTNPYTFQKILNYKLTEVIRHYSQGKGALVFCQTQKGTEMACQQIITDMRERQFIENDQVLMALIQASKRVSNTTLQIMLPQGVAFHNAGLSMQDRTIIQKLFLEFKIRILCTTSTLSMGINLPARLVVIKSTQCYRGSGKGYQQYTRIQMDQMMGRAGRPPFDTQGTVVIMTQKYNYQRYMSMGKLETLESHLYGQLSEHINAQISLRSIKNMNDVLNYFRNSFCYIRMKNSPSSYNIKQNIEVYVENLCMSSINRLNKWNLIRYYPENKSIVPKQLGVNVAKNSIEIDTIVHILEEVQNIKSERDYLGLLCFSEEIKKFRNKLDERKLLKELNETNKYVVKNAISNPQKKCYVILQSELDGRHIQNWQMRKQAKDMIFFMRRLTQCVKTASQEMKLFWPFYWSCLFNKIFTVKFWDRNEQMIIRQFQQLNQKWKALSLRGFKNINHILQNLHQIDTICQKNNQFSKRIQQKVQSLRNGLCFKICPINKINLQRIDTDIEQDEQFKQNPYQRDTLLTIKFTSNFDENFKSILIIVGTGSELYTIRSIKQTNKQISIAFSSSKKYNLGILKNGFVGFDQFYQIINGNQIKKIQDVALMVDVQSEDKINKKDKKGKQKQNDQQESHKDKSHIRQNNIRDSFKMVKRDSSASSHVESKKSIKINKKSENKISAKSNQHLKTSIKTENLNENEDTVNRKTTIVYPSITNDNTLKNSRKKRYQLKKSDDSSTDEEQYLISKRNYENTFGVPYVSYQSEAIKRLRQKGLNNNQKQQNNNRKKQLNIIEESSKSKTVKTLESKTQIGSKKSFCVEQYAFVPEKIIKSKPSLQISKTKEEKEQKVSQKIINSDPYSYFSNLFSI